MSVTQGILLSIVLACTVKCLDDSRADDSPVYTNFTKTLIDAYDVDTSFNDNFFSLLHIFCPESVFCPNDSIQDERAFFGGQNETPVSFSKAFFESRQPLITESSRVSLLSYQYLFKGCCKRCSCASDCEERNNCCPVKQDTDLTDTDRSSIKQECVYPGMHSDTHPTKMRTNAYFMVTDCFLDKGNKTTTRKCESPNKEIPAEITPVYSNNSDRIYRNKFCAACNNDDDVLPWQPKVFFSPGVSIYTLTYISSPEKLYQRLLVHRRTGDLVFIPTNPMLKPKSHYKCTLIQKRVHTNCSNSNLNYDQKSFLQRACAHYKSDYLDLHKSRDNVFCYMCEATKLRQNMCDFGRRDSEYGLIAILSGVATIEENRADTALDGRTCGCTDYLQTIQAVCRAVKCPYGEYYVDCRCVTFLQNWNIRMKIFVDVSPSAPSPGNKPPIRTKANNKIAKAVKAAIKNTFVVRWGKISMEFVAVFSETSSNDSSYLKFFVAFAIQSDDDINMATFKDMLDHLSDGMPIRVLNIPMRLFLGRFFQDNFPDEEDTITQPGFVLQKLFIAPKQPVSPSTMETPSAVLSKLLFCKRVILSEEESEVLNNSSHVSGSNGRLAYIFNEVDSSMCVEDFKARFDKSGMRSSSADFRIVVCFSLLSVANVFDI